MAFFHKWGVKNDFTFALQFFMLISDGLGGVNNVISLEKSGKSTSLLIRYFFDEIAS
jgi:hypothetical protein